LGQSRVANFSSKIKTPDGAPRALASSEVGSVITNTEDAADAVRRDHGAPVLPPEPTVAESPSRANRRWLVRAVEIRNPPRGPEDSGGAIVDR